MPYEILMTYHSCLFVQLTYSRCPFLLLILFIIQKKHTILLHPGYIFLFQLSILFSNLICLCQEDLWFFTYRSIPLRFLYEIIGSLATILSYRIYVQPFLVIFLSFTYRYSLVRYKYAFFLKKFGHKRTQFHWSLQMRLRQPHDQLYYRLHLV